MLLTIRAGVPFRTVSVGERKGEEAEEFEASAGGGGAASGFEGVEVREGEVEEVGGVFESETVLEAEDAEAVGEVAFRHEDEAEEGAGVVGGEFCKGVGCPSTPLGISASLRERAKIMKEKGRIGVEDFIDEVEGVSLAVDGLSGLVGWEEELGETVGDAGGEVPWVVTRDSWVVTGDSWVVTRDSWLVGGVEAGFDTGQGAAGDAAEFRELVDAEAVLVPELAKQFRQVDWFNS